MFLVGDIGGTKSRLAIFSDGADPREPLAEEVFPSDRYPGIESLIQTFLDRKDLTADRACFAVAGPVIRGRAKITNLPWIADAEAIQDQCGIRSVRLLNDLAATARAVPLAVIAVVLYFLFPLTGEKNIARFRTIPQAIASFVGLADAREDGDLTQDEQSTEERKQKNADSWGLIKENIVFGVGVNADPEKFANRFPMARGEVHCEILRAGVIMGIVGMGLYVGFIAILFGCGNWCRTHADGWATLHDLGWTFQIQAVAIAIGGAFCPQPWHSPMMLLAGSASALYCNLKAERAATRKGAR